MKLAASSDFRLQSRDIQQRKLRLPPFEQHGVAFPLVVAEGDILTVDIPVASLQLSDQRAFGYLSAPQKPVWSDIVGERGEQKTVFPELPEHRAELPQVFPQKHIRLSSSWFVPNIFRPAEFCVPNPHTGDVFPSASPRIYE